MSTPSTRTSKELFITMELKGLLSYNEAAALLGVTRPYVYTLVKSGRLRAVSVGKCPLLLEFEVEILVRERAKLND